MDIIVNTRIQWGTLFKGKINWPMDCSVRVEHNQAIIYVDLISNGETPLNLLSILNKTFGTKLPENLFQVRKAGFFSYIRSVEKIDKNLLKKVFFDCGIPENIALEVEDIKAPTCLWCCISIEKLSFFNQLIEIGVDRSENDLDMMALLYKDEALTTLDEFDKVLNECILYTKIPTIKLLGMFIFDNLVLYIKISKDNEYYLKGSIILNDILGYSLICKGKIQVDSEKFYGEFTVSVNNSYDNTLDINLMPSIKFYDMFFCINYNFKDKETACKIKGKVVYFEREIDGDIFFFKDKIYLIDIVLKGDISLSYILENEVHGLTYPKDVFDFAIEDGSELYYCIDNVAPNKDLNIIYQKGFNVFVKLSITLLYTLKLEGHLNINDSGFCGDILFNENGINLYFIQLKAIEDEDNSRPRISFSDNNGVQKIEIRSGLFFLGKKVGIIGCGCYKDTEKNLKIIGYFIAPKAFNKFLGISTSLELKLSFSYSKLEGFHFEDWPSFEFIDDCIDFIKELRAYLNSTQFGCEKIGEFKYQKYFNVTFKFTPKIEDKKEDGVFFILNGLCIFNMNKDEITNIEIDNLIKIKIVDDFTLDNLWNIFVNAIKDSLNAIVKCLINNVEKLLMILAIIAGQEIAKEILNLKCRKLISEEDANILKKAGAIVETVNAGATMEASEIIFGGSLVIGAGVVIIEKSFENEKKLPEVIEPDKPQNLKAVYNNNKIDISWSNVKEATGYLIFVLEEKNNKKVYESKLDSSSNFISIEYKVDSLSDLVVNILAINQYVYSEKSSCNVVQALKPPQNIKIGILKNNKLILSISWECIKDICEYKVCIRNSELDEIYSEKIKSTSDNIDIELAWGCGDFVLNIASISGNSMSDWSKDIKFNLDLSSLVFRAKSNNFTALECGKLLYTTDSSIACKDLVIMMKDVDYNYMDIVDTIREIYNYMTNDEIIDTIIEVYGNPTTVK